MIQMTIPLRYNISNWHQLSKVLSNNSRDLHITVSDMMQNDKLTGTRISVCHKDYGVLFACVLNATGSLVSQLNNETTIEFTPEQILSELQKYGFYVTFEPREHLPGAQLEYLMALTGFKFDKLRKLGIWHYENGVKVFRWCIVAFKVENHVDWINVGYEPSEEEFEKALRNGTAINISAISKINKWSWKWLDYVANIDDILEDNA